MTLGRLREPLNREMQFPENFFLEEGFGMTGKPASVFRAASVSVSRAGIVCQAFETNES